MTRVVAALLGLCAGVAAAGCGDTTGGKPAAGVSAGVSAAAPSATSAVTAVPGPPAAPSAPVAPTRRPPAEGNDVLGPFGWGPVMLGQYATSAGATGVFTDAPAPADTCVAWTAVLASPLESVVVSPRTGVAAIIARVGAVLRTPEDVRIGSTADEVHAAYPAFEVADVDTPNGALIAAPGNPAGVYRLTFDDVGTVSSLTLESVEQDCYG